jgi:hypothetical protein
MNESTKSGGGAEVTIMLMDNKHAKELFGILEEIGKDTSGLTALINHVNGMEDYVKRAENKIADMKAQLDTMKEMQDHPVKTKLQKAVAALETKVAEIKAQIAKLKTNIAEGCKNAVTAFKEKGAAVLDKLASFFHIKSGLQAIKNNTVEAADNCDKAVANIETFAKQDHTAGRSLKNMARMAVGKKPIDAVKESGKLAKVVSAPYKASKAVQLGIRKQANKMIAALDKLEQSTEAKRSEKAAENPKKQPLMARLKAKKEEIKEREREEPKKERISVKGAEI